MTDDRKHDEDDGEETVSQRPSARPSGRPSDRPPGSSAPPPHSEPPSQPSVPAATHERAARSLERPAARPEQSASGTGGEFERRTGSSSGRSSQGSRTTPLRNGERDSELLAIIEQEEAARSSAFGVLSIGTSAMALTWLFFLGGDPTARSAAAAALVSIVAVSGWMIWRFRQPNPNVMLIMRIFGGVVVNAIIAVDFYLGFFSPVVIVKAISIYYVGMARDNLFGALFGAHLTLTWLVCASLVALGVIPDQGLQKLGSKSPEEVSFWLVAVSMTMVAVWYAARTSRAALWNAIRTAHEALARVDNREALLAEAQHQLDRAMRLAVGQPGRYTGMTAGDQTLDVVIGFGAMGEVYSARARAADRRSAVKLLRPEALRDHKLVDRFLREASICQRLQHPNVVRIEQVGRLEDGAPFMAMELLRGQDLASILRRRDRLPWAELVTLARSLGAALDHAHQADVIHRDLKPHNVFEARDPDGHSRWKILDFGISKLGTGSATLTQDGVVGTPSYMSPEQAQALPVDHRSDVFAMAAVLYRAATGRPAFHGKDTPAIMFDVVYRMPQRPTAAHGDLPDALDAVLAVGLAKRPAERFESAGALAAAIAAIEPGEHAPRGIQRRARRILSRLPWGHSPSKAAEASNKVKLGAG